MAAYEWQGNVLTIKFAKADDGADHEHRVDAEMLSQAVRDAAMRFGLQTVLRNATAGKMDEIDTAIKAQKQRLDTLVGGKWAEQKTAKDAIVLGDDEKLEIVSREVVNAYFMKPSNKKTRAEILIAVTEMDLAKKRTSGDPGLQ